MAGVKHWESRSENPPARNIVAGMKQSDALKQIREAQARAAAERAARERQNAEDAAALVVALSRAAEQRELAQAALGRLQQRGETVKGVAELSGVAVEQITALTTTTAEPRRPRTTKKPAAVVNGHAGSAGEEDRPPAADPPALHAVGGG